MPNKFLHRQIHALSGGNKKKLMVLLANLGSPSLLLMDEPTTGVDPVAARRIVDALRLLKPSQGLVFASHRIDEALRVCERAILLNEGIKHYDGSIAGIVGADYYHIDILLSKDKGQSHADALEAVRMRLSVDMNSVILFSSSFFRVTCRKSITPLSHAWTTLQTLQAKNKLARFSFRSLMLEETLSLLVHDPETVTSQEKSTLSYIAETLTCHMGSVRNWLGV
jgi:ABC-type multidrug transport system ATPase subunit